VKQVSYEDEKGRVWVVSLPDDASVNDAPHGIPVGPPSLEPLGLPLALEVRLHNILVGRQLLTLADVKRRRQDVFAAWQQALAVDTDRIVQLYYTSAQQEAAPPVASQRKRGAFDRRKR
jgi:hypothetical protein